MLDRHKIETILTRRFPGAGHDQVAAAANAIMGLQEEWVEVLHPGRPTGYHTADECRSVCYLVDDVDADTEFRLFRRRSEVPLGAPPRPESAARS